MRTVEIRRHSYTKKGDERGRGSHLSAEGVSLARSVGMSMQRPDAVLASPFPRTVETALAFGFSVDDTYEVGEGDPWGGIPVHAWWEWEQPYVEVARRIAQDHDVARAAASMKAALLDALARAPDGGRTLVVSHGGVIELGLVACLPNADHASWGPPFSQCDGAELDHDGESFTSIRFARAA